MMVGRIFVLVAFASVWGLASWTLMGGWRRHDAEATRPMPTVDRASIIEPMSPEDSLEHATRAMIEAQAALLEKLFDQTRRLERNVDAIEAGRGCP